MANEVKAPVEIDNKDLCPEGWRKLEGCLLANDPCPVLSYMGELYVPKSKQPRTWKGAVLVLAGPTNPVWEWGDGVIVEVTEVRQSG